MKLAIDPKKFDLTRDPSGKKVEKAMQKGLVAVMAWMKEKKQNEKTSFSK